MSLGMDMLIGDDAGGGLNASTLLAIWNILGPDERRGLLAQTNTSNLNELVALLEHHDRPLEHEYYEYPEYRLERALMLYVPPIFLILGTVGNLLSFIILMRRSMRRYSTYLYLATLSITDTLVLYIGLLRLWVGELTGYDPEDQSDGMCKAINLVGYTISTYSVWLIVAVTVERFVAVCYPLRAPSLCNRRRACHVMLGLLVTLFCINLHFIWTAQITIEQEKQYCDGGSNYVTLVTVVWPWVDACLYSILPSSVILILNIIIIRNVITAKKSRAEMQSAGGRKPDPRRGHETSYKLTFMLLTISFSFLITTFPMNISLISTPFYSTYSNRDPIIARFNLVRAITTLLMFINHSINFFLYCATGQKFRQQLILMMCHRCQKPGTVRYDLTKLYNGSSGTTMRFRSSGSNSDKRPLKTSYSRPHAKDSVAEIRKGDYVQVKVSPL